MGFRHVPSERDEDRRLPPPRARRAHGAPAVYSRPVPPPVNDGIPEPAPLLPEADELARPVRAAPSRDRIEEWALVLAATGIDHQIARADDGTYLLFVPGEERHRAVRALALYDEE